MHPNLPARNELFVPKLNFAFLNYLRSGQINTANQYLKIIHPHEF